MAEAVYSRLLARSLETSAAAARLVPAYRVRVLPRARVHLEWCNRRTTLLSSPPDPRVRTYVRALVFASSLPLSLPPSLSLALSLSLESSLVEATTWRPFGTVRWGRERGRHLLRAALYASRNFTTAGAFIAILPGSSFIVAEFLRDAGGIFRHSGRAEKMEKMKCVDGEVVVSNLLFFKL